MYLLAILIFDARCGLLRDSERNSPLQIEAAQVVPMQKSHGWWHLEEPNNSVQEKYMRRKFYQSIIVSVRSTWVLLQACQVMIISWKQKCWHFGLIPWQLMVQLLGSWIEFTKINCSGVSHRVFFLHSALLKGGGGIPLSVWRAEDWAEQCPQVAHSVQDLR